MTELHPHPVPPHARRLRLRRRQLLVGCAFGAASLLAGHADRASAQAFQLNDANATVAAGSVILSRDSVSTPGTETITVNSPTAIINWNRAETDFLPQNNVATFQNGSGTTDFVVLNRVLGLNPGAVEFNGTVRSQVNGNPGGTLIFQSDGGIIVGPTALFDVGNLVLTTLPVIDETGYGDIVNDGGGFDFGFGEQFGAQIVIEPGARINALANGSYVVMAAPGIDQGGTVRVNGSAAYIGARQASFSINAGLFDIVITNGSDLDPPIRHTGSTLWPTSAGAADPRRIYMATRTSFDPVTMLLSGNMGADAATGATVENGQIVLSAGFDIANGAIVDDIDRNDNSTYKYSEANIRITGGTFTADVVGRATQDAIVVSDDGALSFSGDLNLVAYNEARLSATDGNVNVAGAVGLTSLGALEFGYGSSALAIGPLALDVTGSDVSITAENGNSVVIAGDATLDASAVGDFDNVDDLDAGFGQGGNVRVEVDSTGGQITFQSNLAMNATGTGAADSRTPDTGGDGFGGSATIRALAGEIAVDGGVAIDLRGTGTGGTTSAGGGFGGNASISAAGGDVRIAGATTIDTRGTGGAILGTPAGGTVGGEGSGGFVSISADGGDEVSFGTSTSIDSRGLGGTGAVGGAGNGGGVSLSTGFGTGGRILAGTTLGVDASGTCGAGRGGNGGAGTGAFVGFTASAAGGLIGGSTNVTIASNGTGGIGTVSPAGGPTVGGAGLGGDVSLIAETDSGVIQLGNISVSSVGTGGAGFDGGAGTGGDVFAGTEVGYGSTGAPSNATFGNLDFVADGTGGAGSRNGGTGTGGSALVGAQAGQVSFGGASNLSARGTGGAAGNQAGGAGQGGSVGIRAFSGQTLLASAGSTVLDASGVGGQGGTGLGTGGNGTGGTASIQAFGGTLTLSGSFALSADGTGGVSSPDIPPVGIGGNGQGGTASIQATPGGQITMGAAALSAVGTGGDGILGGNGTGGRNEITGISGGRVTAGNVTAAADGIGGGGNDTQNGGVGTGGLVRLIAEADGGAIVLGDVTATARGVGGSASGSGNGGAGNGGDLFAGTELGYGGTGSAATATFGNISLDGSGIGGNANTGQAGNGLGSGADGQGGGAQIQANVGQVTIGGASSVIALGFGGSSNGAAGNGTGGIAGILARTGATLTGNSAGQLQINAIGIGTSGDGTGGTAFVAADGGTITLAGDIAVRANGQGGDGGSFFAGGAGAGGLARLAAFNGGSVSFANATVTSDGFGGIGGAGGVGRAGNSTQPEVQVVTGAFLVAQNGTITGASATVAARGVGGDSAGVSDPLAARSDGGDGFGGTAQIVALNAAGPSTIELGSAIVDISAQGGGGATSYSGGDATAGVTGVVLAETLGNSIDIDAVALFANAVGGDSGGAIDSLIGNGGNATAGQIQIGLSSGFGTGTTGGTGRFGSIQGSANAIGGAGVADGSNGGFGVGGSVGLLNRGGTMTAGDVTFVANGTGGAGGAAATGGDGTAGQVVMRLTPRFQTTDGGTATIGAVSMSSTGTGGSGGTQGASFYASAPTDSVGVVEVIGSSATFASIAIDIAGDAPSEPGLAPVRLLFTDSQVTVTGGLSVNAPGAVELLADDATFGAGTANIVTPQTVAFTTAGAGQFAGGAWTVAAGGDITIADATLAADSPTIDVGSFAATTQGDFTADSNSVIRTSGALLIDAAGAATVSGALAGGAIEVRGASIDVAAADGTAIDLEADDALVAGDLNATGDITFAAGGAASFDSVDAGGRFAGSAATLTVPDATAAVIDLTATGGAAQLGAVSGTTSLAVTASDDVSFDTLAGGSVTIASSGGSVTGASATGTNLAFNAVDGVTVGSASASGDVTFQAGGAASFDSVDAGGRFAGSAASLTVPDATAAVIDLTATGGAAQLGAVSGTTSLAVTASDDVSFDTLAGGSVTIASSGGSVTGASATGTNLAFNAVDGVTVDSASASGDVTFQAGGAASFDSVDAGGRFAGSAASLTVPDATAAVVDLSATGGSAELGTVAGTTSLTVNATGTVTFDALTGGSVAIASGSSIVGASASGTTIDFDAQQTASFSGTIVGNEIRVTSRDIVIGDQARLGGANTQLVELEARPGQQVFIGGNAQGYTLTNAEAGRIRTAALEITASPTGSGASRPPDVVVRDLTLNAAPTPTGAGVGTLGITLGAGEGGSGILSVEGALAMNNAGANNGVTLTATGGRVQIVNPQGSIRVLGASGLPAGNLEIDAANIWSASQSIIDQLVANPAFAGRDDALGTNGGTTAERGYIEGGEILMRVGSTLFVQNSGTADQFAGITVVQNTLTIEPTSSGQIDVFAYGRRINADGTFVVNSPYFREVEFGDRGRYLASAEFNNCIIATGFCSGDVPPGLPVGSEVIEGPVEDTEESVPPPNPDRQEFVDVSFATESLLEEPVTSGGDSGVWDGEDGDCPPGEVCEPGTGGNP